MFGMFLFFFVAQFRRPLKGPALVDAKAKGLKPCWYGGTDAEFGRLSGVHTLNLTYCHLPHHSHPERSVVLGNM